ncbi:MAG: HpcH/HpaI aldolase/citrate lyase family protein [Caulobacterales bacterium]
MTFHSLLFVPGNRPDRFGKAASAATVVCIDLEDAVPPDQKDDARAATCAWLQGATTPPAIIGVRINHPSTPEGKADAEAILAQWAAASSVQTSNVWSEPPPAHCGFLMVPKVNTAADLATLKGPPLWPIIESGIGLKNAWDIAAAPNVMGILFGAVDFAADIGCTLEWDALIYARGRLAAACGAAGIELLDVPFLDVRDEEGLIASTRRSKALGFTGRACIHPSQIAPVRTAFKPTAAEVEWARRVVRTLAQANGAAALMDGKLIERPVARTAQRILEQAGDA